MGQYYEIYLKRGKRVTHYDRSVNGEYMMAKLTEHSWWENETMTAITKLLYKKPAVVAWVGDYSKDIMNEEQIKTVYNKIWGEKALKDTGLTGEGMTLDGKYLVNHDKREYLDCDKYKRLSDRDGWILHPLSLLTAMGNGMGGGDYWGVNKDLVGSWALNTISVEDEIPDGFTEFNCYFAE